jgi:hypothetical protein
MTLVITEVSEVGIAMAADSMLTFNATIAGTVFPPERNHRKLFQVPKITGGVSYWGAIGLVFHDTMFATFSEWLQAHISVSQATNIKDFAEGLASSLNHDCKNTPLPKDKSMGLHVAAYGDWGDGKRRPIFYHVHNGDLHYEWKNKHTTDVAIDPTGDKLGLRTPASVNQQARRRILDTFNRHGGFSAKPVLKDRQLFRAEQDFPLEGAAVSEGILKGGYATKNGDSILFSLMQQQDDLARDNAQYTYPGEPAHSLDNALHRLLDQVRGAVSSTKNNGLTETFGEPLWILGIDEQGYTAGSNLPLGSKGA